MKKAFSIASELKTMEIDLLNHPSSAHMSHEPKLAKEYHLSLSRTVPIRVHQINSIVAMLQHKFECQKGLVLFFLPWNLTSIYVIFSEPFLMSTLLMSVLTDKQILA